MSNSSKVARFDGGVEAITAASTALATATALTGGINNVTTATGETGVKLPSNYTVGVPIVVLTLSATTALLFPGTAAQKINNGSAGASVNVAQSKAAVCYFDGTNWVVTVGA